MLTKCSECGHEVSDKANSVPIDGQCATARQEPVRRKGMVKCSKCGYEHSFDAERCPKCGSLNGVRLALMYIVFGVVLLIAFCIYMVIC